MREILFRGKRLDNGEWVEGAFCPKNSEGDIPCIIVYNGTLAGWWLEVDHSTVGQFTGKQDKTGRKIFDGDILCVIERGETLVGYVVFNTDRGEWVVQGTDGSFCNMARRKDVEIIGNIHDSLELLEVNEDG